MTKEKHEPLFNAGAAVYDSFRFLHAPADRTADQAGLQPGMEVLDVACGSGRTTIAAARVVGSSGRVTGIDIADRLLGIARRKAGDAGFTTVTFITGRAEHLGFSKHRFDAVTCASSLFLFSDMLQAVSECWRVLKPGGKLVFSTFGDGLFQPVTGMIDAALREDGFEGLPVPVSAKTDSPEKCSDILLASGIYDFTIVTENLDIFFTTAEECWQQTANSLFIRPGLAYLNRDRYRELKRNVIGELETTRTNDGIGVRVPTLFITIKKPFDLPSDSP